MIDAATAIAPAFSSILCREARALLDWEEGELAFVARMPLATVLEFERGTAAQPAPALTALRRALERGGVEFAPEDGGRGVRLRKVAKRPAT
jgi:hypothetical protein